MRAVAKRLGRRAAAATQRESYAIDGLVFITLPVDKVHIVALD